LRLGPFRLSASGRNKYLSIYKRTALVFANKDITFSI
jgi:hypothetical protein